MTLLAAILLAATNGLFPGVHASGEEVIGSPGTHQVAEDESLIEIARDFDLGYNTIVEANPDLDPFVPGTGAAVALPTSWILPRAASPGAVVINLSEMRLYYFSPPRPGDGGWVVTFPIGIGSEGAETPLGTFQVVARQRNPVWRVPVSIRKEDPELPAEVPPGPDNPLGTHALRLSAPFILMHGTDKPWAVGRRASHGCLRLYPEDIPWLYQLVHVGTDVIIVREPVKVGVRDARIYVEVHTDPDAPGDNLVRARKLLTERGLADRISPTRLEEAVQRRSGMPVDVTR